MSRRDTIIIAVLVNAGLLMVLFATAMRSGKKEEKEAPTLAEASTLPKETMLQLSNNLPLNEPPLATLENSILDAPLSAPNLTDNTSDMLADTLNTAVDEIEIAVPNNVAATVAPLPSVATIEKPILKAPEVVKEAITVTVKKGDVLEKIAKSHQTSVAAIMKTNNLQSTNLKIGQVLKMPSGVLKKEGSTAIASANSSSSESVYYTVKEGDNPWLIASRNNVKLDALLKLNSMDEQKAKKLRPGDRLRIR